jgi:hypothetical protein
MNMAAIKNFVWEIQTKTKLMEESLLFVEN